MKKLLPLLFALASAACEPGATRPNHAALYLKVQVEQDGRTVASPHLLGFEGRHITVEKRAARSEQLDYRMDLVPREEGATFAVRFDLELPNGHSSGRVVLLHGEERRVRLDGHTELKLMLMRVDSPEFRMLVMRDPVREAAI